MSGQVETRRFRTWEPDTDLDPTKTWRVILKFGIVRMLRAWHMRLLLVLSLIFAVSSLGSYSYDLAYVPNGSSGDDVLAAVGLVLGPAVAYLLFVGAPMFSEDLRFNAPLFYFSKPVTARDYVLGKAAVLVSVLAVTVLLPFLLFLILTLIGAVTAEPVDWAGQPLPSAARADWDATSINSFGDWLFVVAVTLPGVLVYLVFLSSLFVAFSAWTQRAWHAAIGAVAAFGAWSILGLTAGDIGRSAVSDVFGPLGWIQVMVFAPVERRYGWWQNWNDGTVPDHLTNLDAAVPLAYVMTLAATALCWAATHWKLRRMEGIL